VVQLARELRDFLTAGSRTGKLGWVAADRRPLVTPIWFVVEGDDLLFSTAATSAKGRASGGRRSSPASTSRGRTSRARP
jgi:nitroimidazol reductase NimA-like FMN-containing flavoprotein (pyridoxamine 5'-phosphate oxidase superfamily)